MENTLIPHYTRGKRRRSNPPYRKLHGQIKSLRKAGRGHDAQLLTQELRSLPSSDPHDPNFRRLRYTRYADDFLLGFAGTRSEALTIRDDLSRFLAETLNLELNEEKTLITHAGSQPAKYLGYHLQPQHEDSRISNGRRMINGKIGLRVPPSVFFTHRRYYSRYGKPIHNPLLLYHSDYYIVRWYQARFRGLVQYYLLAWNVSSLQSLKWIMEQSLMKTLAAKYDTTVMAIVSDYVTTVPDPSRPGQQLRAIVVTVDRSKEGLSTLTAQFGGIPLRRNPLAIVTDTTIRPYVDTRSDLLDRKNARRCELCEIENVPLEIHHVNALRNILGKSQRNRALWEKIMIAMQRKTLAVCVPCHQIITHGKYDRQRAIK